MSPLSALLFLFFLPRLSHGFQAHASSGFCVWCSSLFGSKRIESQITDIQNRSEKKRAEVKLPAVAFLGINVGL